MNKKGISLPMELIIIAAIMLIVLVISVPMVYRYFYKPIAQTGEYSGCEKGNFGAYGQCVEETFICPSSNNVGALLSGCPSSKTSSLLKDAQFDKSVISQYTKCCIVNDCSDIKDRKGTGDKSTYIPREELKITNEKETEKCIGYSENCQPPGCCCVLGIEAETVVKEE